MVETPIDFSSGAMPVGMSESPVGNTWRGIGADWFNAGNVAKEDWLRNEQTLNNEYLRNLSSMNEQAKLNDSLAQRSYEREREGRQTQYQDIVSSLKAAGLNPILAYQNSGSSVSGGNASVSASGSRSGYASRLSSAGALGNLLSGLISLGGGVMQLVGSLYSAEASLQAASADKTIKSVSSGGKTVDYHHYYHFNKK